MNLQSRYPCAGSSVLAVSIATLVTLGIAPGFSRADTKSKNPASKVFVADVSGDAIIDTGDTIEDMAKRSVYTAQGTIIQTKKPDSESERSKNFSTMVYSNGTGAFFDADTRVEMRTFMQEPFTPNRADIESEPSISQTQAFLARGTVGLCNSKLVAGSNMTYQTAQGSVSIRGRKVVIEASQGVTKVSMLEGDSTVRAGANDLAGNTLKTGEQAIIRPGPPGMPNTVQIDKIPKEEMPQLDDKVAMACMAKKSVYFEVRERTTDAPERSGTKKGPAGDGGRTGNNDGTGSTTNGSITAFDGNSGGASSITIREIVPVQIVPTVLPVEYTISPARVITSTNGPTR